ncbi:Uncharacterised protein [Mycolicibacterium tokaiense]|uniref:Uncharacterized protein n=1 Tax=Mycolicibacterium tokaiense TaxID=39695 RepID=A0A378TNM6_9MYCO|nr:hypothetical protein MTOK_50850 [Mycolicibacterium tokaiense]STZ62309.1 Uncharacterised protein [Mycolicibacterium tokaiense]
MSPEEPEWETVSSEFTIRLRDGGVVVIADIKDLVELGEGTAARNAVYRRDGMEIAWEVRDRVPLCTSVVLRADDSGLRTKDLHAIRLDDVREIVYEAVGIGVSNSDGDEFELTPAETRKAVNHAASRRTMTDERLRRVADIHRKAPEGRRTAAVRAAFNVHERTAPRYIAKAKDEGYLRG